MARSVEIELEDGTRQRVDGIPDSKTPTEVSEWAADKFGQGVTRLHPIKMEEVKTPESSDGVLTREELADYAKDRGKEVVAGIALGGQGAMEFVNLLSKAPQLPEKAIRAGLNKLGANLKAPEDIGDKFLEGNRATIEGMFPRKEGDSHYLRSAVEGFVGAAPFIAAGGPVVPQAMAATTSGLGGELGEQTIGGPFGRIVGSLTGGLGYTGADALTQSIYRRFRPNAKRDLIEALFTNEVEVPVKGPLGHGGKTTTKRELLPELEKAPERMRAAAKEGLHVAGPQTLPYASQADEAVTVLGNHPSGQAVQRVLREQPNEVAYSLNTKMAATLPGQVTNKTQASNAVHRAAGEYEDLLRTHRTNTWRRIAKDAPDFTDEQVALLDSRLAAFAKENAGKQSAELANAVRAKLRNPEYNPDAEGAVSAILDVSGRAFPGTPQQTVSKYLQDPLHVKDVIDETIGLFGADKLNLQGVQRKGLFGESQVRDIVNSLYEENGGVLREANRAYEALTKAMINPSLESVTGKIAGRTGALDGIPAPEKVFALFDTGTANSNKSEIRKLAIDLQKSNPKAFPEAVSTWFQTKLYNIADKSGHPEGDYAEKVYRELFATPAKRQGFRDMVIGSARSMGHSQDEVRAAVRAVDTYINLLEMAQKRGAKVTGMTRGQMNELAGASVLSEGIQSAGNFMMARWARKTRLSDQNSAYAWLDKRITTPEGMQEIINLAKQSKTSTALRQALITAVVAGERLNPQEIPADITPMKQEQ